MCRIGGVDATQTDPETNEDRMWLLFPTTATVLLAPLQRVDFNESLYSRLVRRSNSLVKYILLLAQSHQAYIARMYVTAAEMIIRPSSTPSLLTSRGLAPGHARSPTAGDGSPPTEGQERDRQVVLSSPRRPRSRPPMVERQLGDTRFFFDPWKDMRENQLTEHGTKIEDVSSSDDPADESDTYLE